MVFHVCFHPSLVVHCAPHMMERLFEISARLFKRGGSLSEAEADAGRAHSYVLLWRAAPAARIVTDGRT